jgi:hypothetical protein
MKTLELEKKTGVWIDKHKAIFLSFIGNEFKIKTIESEIETRERVDGESGHISRFGSQSVSPESKKENRLNEQKKVFLKKVMDQLAHSDEFVVFGPADMKLSLAKVLKEKPLLNSKLKGLEDADDMTENQMSAWVKTYFKK